MEAVKWIQEMAPIGGVAFSITVFLVKGMLRRQAWETEIRTRLNVLWEESGRQAHP